MRTVAQLDETYESDINTLKRLRATVANGFLNICIQTNQAHFYTFSMTKLELDLDVIIKAIENHIDGALLEEYGGIQGRKNAIKMYRHMLDTPTLNGKNENVKLSEVGINLMNDLFQTMINDFESNGFQIPKPPVKH